MLVLSRRVGEVIVIGANIQITVLSVTGEKVRLGFIAPPSVRVDRQEVHSRRTQELDDFAVPEARLVGEELDDFAVPEACRNGRQ